MPIRHGALLIVLLFSTTIGCGTRTDSNVSQQNRTYAININGGAPVEGSGKLATEERNTEGFQRVEARDSVEVMLAVAGTESVTVEADDNLLPLVETKVEKDTLRIGVKGSLKTRNPLRVRVSAKQLEGVTAASSARVSSKDLKGDNISLAASESAQVTANNLDAQQLKISVSSAGSVTANGRTDRQEISASSSGRYAGSKLVSRTSRVTCDSAAAVELHATEEISGSVSSAGSVRYSGNPGKVAVSTSSAGSVQAAGK